MPCTHFGNLSLLRYFYLLSCVHITYAFFQRLDGLTLPLVLLYVSDILFGALLTSFIQGWLGKLLGNAAIATNSIRCIEFFLCS